MTQKQVLDWAYDILGGLSALFIGLGTSSWFVGFGVLLGFGAIKVSVELVFLDHK